MKTLATEFAALRDTRGLTLLEVANRCKIAESTVWKIENGRSIRWETVHLCLQVLNVTPDQYAEIQALWLEQRNAMADSHPGDFNSPKQEPHTAAAIRKFRKLISGLGSVETAVIVSAAERAAGWLE